MASKSSIPQLQAFEHEGVWFFGEVAGGTRAHPSLARIRRVPAPGDRVWYSPTWRGARFAAVVDGPPRALGETWCIPLRDLGDDYQRYTGRPGRSTVSAAALTHVEVRDAG